MSLDLQPNAQKTEGQTTANSGSGNQPSSFEVIRQADERVKRITEENERLERNLAELRELYTRMAMGGQTTSNVQQKAPEVSPKDYALMALTGKLNQN